MLYDTRTSKDFNLPGNAKVGWSYEAQRADFSLPIEGCNAAGFAAGDLICIRSQPDGSIKIWKGRQVRERGKSSLQQNKRLGGAGYYYAVTTAVSFRLSSFSRCGVSVWVPALNEMYLSAPAKENLMPPRVRGERKVAFTFEEAVGFMGASTTEQLTNIRMNDAELWDALMRGLAKGPRVAFG